MRNYYECHFAEVTWQSCVQWFKAFSFGEETEKPIDEHVVKMLLYFFNQFNWFLILELRTGDCIHRAFRTSRTVITIFFLITKLIIQWLLIQINGKGSLRILLILTLNINIEFDRLFLPKYVIIFIISSILGCLTQMTILLSFGLLALLFNSIIQFVIPISHHHRVFSKLICNFCIFIQSILAWAFIFISTRIF